jgi:5-(carboxyamino)imidazole ribonucleotide mutase
MQAAVDVLDGFGVRHEVHVMSAHRTPARVAEFAAAARDHDFGVIICGAGKAAHLAGAVAAHSTVPVIASRSPPAPWEASTPCSPPSRCPPGSRWRRSPWTAANAGYLAVAILSLQDPGLAAALDAYRESLRS